MLQHLRVKNTAVLEEASIDPGPGFTVITGETGAGKTLLLGALRLLAGERPGAGTVGPFGEEAVVEGLFERDGAELGATRVVPRQGRSRAYLDGTLVATAVLEEKIGALVEIVGQHDRLLLRRPSNLLAMVDGALDEEGRELRAGYATAWEALRQAEAEQAQLGGDRIALERELDLVRYQAEEIARAGLQPDDDERLEAMATRLRNAELIREHLVGAVAGLESVVESSGDVVASLRKVVALDPAAEEALAGVESISALAQEAIRSVRDLAETTTSDPGELEELEARLTALGDLKRKYGRTLEEVLHFGEQMRRRADELASLLQRAATIDDEVAARRGEVGDLAVALHQARAAAAGRITTAAHSHLADLGLRSAKVVMSVEPVDPGASGGDRANLSFSSDERLAAGSVADIASGGELSRLVLAVRLATASAEVGALVFDEVDAGVGGATALALGQKLAALAEQSQVLCVTHLPQVAAHADTHYVVEREGPVAAVRRVEGEERLTELSRMLAGLPDSERGREAAAELLDGARAR